ncbi:uncharacterized [Tachysurus ichikawai]
MEVRVRRKHGAREKKRERMRARSRLTSDQQYLVVSQWSFTARVRSVVRSLVTRLRQSVLFSWLCDATVTLKQSIVGDASWPVALVKIGLWLLLLLSNLHMGLPCFLLALVYWLYNTYGGGPALTSSIALRQEK